MKLVKGGLKPLSPADRLKLSFCFVAIGESFRSFYRPPTAKEMDFFMILQGFLFNFYENFMKICEFL